MRQVRGDSVVSFERKYVTSNRAAQILGTGSFLIQQHLNGLGIEPIKKVPELDLLLWARSDIEKLKAP